MRKTQTDPGDRGADEAGLLHRDEMLARTIDADLVDKKLADIETFVHQLRTMTDFDRLHTDFKEERYALRTLYLAIQSALDAASHLTSDKRVDKPATDSEVLQILGNRGWLEPELTDRLRQMAELRYLLIFRYGEVNLDEVEQILRHRLEDFDLFVATIRSRLT